MSTLPLESRVRTACIASVVAYALQLQRLAHSPQQGQSAAQKGKRNANHFNVSTDPHVGLRPVQRSFKYPPWRHPRQVPSAGRMERILHCRRSGRDVGQGRSTLPVGNGCATTCSDGGGGPRPFWTPGGEEGLVRRFPRSIPRQVGRERGHVVQGACLGGGGGCKRGSSSGKAKPNERYTAESVFHEAAEK